MFLVFKKYSNNFDFIWIEFNDGRICHLVNFDLANNALVRSYDIYYV